MTTPETQAGREEPVWHREASGQFTRGNLFLTSAYLNALEARISDLEGTIARQALALDRAYADRDVAEARSVVLETALHEITEPSSSSNPAWIIANMRDIAARALLTPDGKVKLPATHAYVSEIGPAVNGNTGKEASE